MKFPRTKKSFRAAVAAGLAVGAAAVSTASHAALDLTSTGSIATALTSATTDAVSAGALVIACVAGVVVIGMVIQMVRKA